MIHMTQQTIDWIVNKMTAAHDGHGVYTISNRENFNGACGQKISFWQPKNYDPQEDKNKHYATAIAWDKYLADKCGIELYDLLMHYRKVNCPKCIKILKENGL